MPIQSCNILSHDQLAGDVYRLTFYSELISQKAQPGQFVHIRVNDRYDPLLRRPFSIHDIDHGTNGVSILFQVLGTGTHILASKKVGESVDVLGPLGRGFDMTTVQTKSVVVSGGIGIAPFPFLIRKLRANGDFVVVVAGWKTAEEVVGIDEMESLGIPVEVSTEDGSRGYTGTVVDLLQARLEGWLSESNGLVLYTCGPGAMLAKVARLSRQHGLPCQVSLEEKMACGIGACYGCGVQGTDENDYKLVCKDGPVFSIDEVILR